MDKLEDAFLSKTQKLIEKRQAQLKERMAKMLPSLIKLYEQDKLEEVERLIETMKVPMSKEWSKNIVSLMSSSAKNGVLRAHLELLRLKELYEFDEDDWEIDLGDPVGEFEVNFPKEAEDWIRNRGYEIGVITDDTVRGKIRDEVRKSLVEGTPPRELTARINDVTDTWVSLTHAETIARTETAKMYNAGRLARWLDPEAGDMIQALQYDAIVDTRTTDLCKRLDGKIVSVTNTKAIADLTPPNHFKCRATWIAVTKYEEWQDDFPAGEQPQKGFNFQAPMPLLKGKKTKPLVTPKKVVDPKTITDPLIIRNLPDEDFRVAIGNITDTEMKFFLIKERAEQMLVSKKVMEGVTVQPHFLGNIYFVDDSFRFKMNAFDNDLKEYVIKTNGSNVEDLREFMEEMEKDKLNLAHLHGTIDKFIDKHSGNFNHTQAILVLQEAKKSGLNKAKFNKFQEVTDRTAEAKALLTVKRPPKSANYKSAKRLQQAVDEGEEFMLKYVSNRLAPASGIQMRFKNDLNRAYATGATGEIFFGSSEWRAGVIVHESAHVMHWNNKEVAELINTFFMRRTKNLTIDAGKRHGEKVLKDDFFNSYIGRIYGWEDGWSAHKHTKNGKQFYGQEVFSMGLQAMQENPTEFYNADREHFLFTYALMEGLF